MVVVVETCQPKLINCGRCNSLLQYRWTDIQKYCPMIPVQNYIICPVCNFTIEIKMIREERYLVLKQTDIDNALDSGEQLELSCLALKVHNKRIENGKQPLEAVVVESDWPEYEPVWKMIEERVDREDAKCKFEKMFDDKERLGYFFAVETQNGKFLITSDAHSNHRLKNYSGYRYRALFSPDCGFDNKEILTTNWGTCFKKVTLISFEELVALYDPNASISNYNIAKFIINKLNDDAGYIL